MNRQEKTRRLAVSAMLSALGVVLLALGSAVEIMDISMAVIASLLCVYAVIELGGASPWLIFAVTGVLSLLLIPQWSASVMYVCFFGYYPILKEKFEKHSRVLAWLFKELVFHGALAVIWLVLRYALLTPDLIGLSPIFLVVLLVGAELVFLLYDIALTRLISFYLWKLRDRFRRK